MKLGTMKAFLFFFITLSALTVWQTTQTGHGNLISRTQVLNVKKILFWIGNGNFAISTGNI